MVLSLDDGEMANLRHICDDIFGEDNFVADIVWEKRFTRNNDAQMIASVVDHILFYRKSTSLSKLREPRTEKSDSIYKNPDSDPRGPWTSVSYISQRTKDQRKNLSYEILNPITGEKISHETNAWKYSESQYLEHAQENRLHWGIKGENKYPRLKRFLSELDYGLVPVNLWNYKETGTLDDGTKILTELIGKDIFDYPKPPSLIRRMLSLSARDPGDIILDFFSGSATTAHAVMQQNAEDGGNRRYIMVQLPEVCAENSEAAKARYKTIAEIGKERIRRAGEKIKEDLQTKHNEWKKQQALESKKGDKLDLEDDTMEESNPYVLDPDSLDIGFKSFRIEDTKINWLKKDLRGEQLEFDDTTTQDALDFVPGYTDTDVVYELMLRQSNIPLTGSITKPNATAKRTYLYADAYLICLEEKITQKLVETLATIEPTPNKYFFRDSAFGTDIALKDETFRRLKAEIHKHHGDLGAAYTVEFI